MPLRTAVLLSALVFWLCPFSTAMGQDEALPHAPEQRLKVAVAPMMSPRDTFSSYFQLLHYLGGKLGMDIDFVQRKTHAEVRDLLQSGNIDMAFICSGPYALADADAGQDLLAMPVVHGATTYQSYIIVNAASPAHSLADLRGGTFAFTDPDSNTGYLNALYLLHQAGAKPETFFRSTMFTHSHDNSILAVTRGLVDAAAVNSMVWDYYAEKRPAVTAKTRILVKSGAFAMPPVVTSAKVPAEKREAIRNVLLHLHESAQGRAMLQALRIDRFIVPEDAWYASIRRVAREVPTEARHEATLP